MPVKSPKQIEVELRARFSERKFDALKQILDKYATNLGEDDKDTYFFILPDKLVKVVNNISQKNARIVLKLNKIGKGSDFEEIEFGIDPHNVSKAVKLFLGLGLKEIQHSFQKRHNYRYRSVELALKYSKTWGHHLEFEMMVADKKDIPVAEAKLKALAKKLGVKIMSDNELRAFTAKKDKQYRDRKKQPARV